MAKAELYKRICPRCNSTDTEVDFTNPGTAGSGISLSSYKCNNCGNRGRFFPEVEARHLPKVKTPKEVGKRDLIDTTLINFFGGMRRTFWKIGGTITLIVAIILILSKNNPSLLYHRIAPYTFYMGLLVLLPFSITILLVSFKRELVQKHAFLRWILCIILISCYSILPIIAATLASSAEKNLGDTSMYDPLNSALYTKISDLRHGSRVKVAGELKTYYEPKSANNTPFCNTYYYLEDDTGKVLIKQISGPYIGDLRDEEYSAYVGKRVEIRGTYRDYIFKQVASATNRFCGTLSVMCQCEKNIGLESIKILP